MALEFKFTGDQLARFIPDTGYDLVGFDEARGKGAELFLIQHFDVLADAEAAMTATDATSFISFAKPQRRATQLGLFDDPSPPWISRA